MIVIKMCGCVITWVAIFLFLTSLLGAGFMLGDKSSTYDAEIVKATEYNKGVIYVKD